MVTAGPWMSSSPVLELLLLQVMTGAGLPVARHSRVREEPSLTVYWPADISLDHLYMIYQDEVFYSIGSL